MLHICNSETKTKRRWKSNSVELYANRKAKETEIIRKQHDVRPSHVKKTAVYTSQGFRWTRAWLLSPILAWHILPHCEQVSSGFGTADCRPCCHDLRRHRLVSASLIRRSSKPDGPLNYFIGHYHYNSLLTSENMGESPPARHGAPILISQQEYLGQIRHWNQQSKDFSAKHFSNWSYDTVACEHDGCRFRGAEWRLVYC